MPASFGDVKFTQENICKIVPSLESVEKDVQRVQSLHQERTGTRGNGAGNMEIVAAPVGENASVSAEDRHDGKMTSDQSLPSMGAEPSGPVLTDSEHCALIRYYPPQKRHDVGPN